MSDEADAFRRWGHLQADLDPLGRIPPFRHPELDACPDSPWRKTYGGTLAAEFMHLPWPDRVEAVRAAMESEPTAPDRERILDLLLRSDLFEKSLHARYPGTKRFSLEGLTAVLPLLAELFEVAAVRGAEQVVIGMSHRGRLNVMAHLMGRPARDIVAGFEDADPRSVLGGGDVKYHRGANGGWRTRKGGVLHVCLASNPSHLEAVDPVVLGRTRARQERLGGVSKIVPVLLHGDAAFAGQGMVPEILNLAGLPAYAVGGAIHVVLNNLIGFTAEPAELHSGRLATDLARGFGLPIFHVNGEDPEAAVRAARIAVDYRSRFGSDVVIDLVGYRRHGHSEVEDPTTTQPLLYKKIAALPPLAESYAKRIGADLAAKSEAIQAELRAELDAVRGIEERPTLRRFPSWWDNFKGGAYDAAYEVDTGVSAKRLAELGERLARAPEGFHLHPKVAQLLERRQAMARGEAGVDWGTAESLALGTLLIQGVPLRLTGQDSRRGTFNQRHAAWIDVESGDEYFPLAALGRCVIADSPLSEAGPLGFEYGYSRDFPEALVLWEAQFGDFANGAQPVLDQFLSAAEDKWGLLSGLVLLLPHGFEGQGPEHSSARLERWLQLCAEDNWQVAQPTTSAQYFHLLRRQALRKWRKPLVVMTPKGLLRHPFTASPIADLASGRFRTVLGDSVENAQRVLLCTGRIAADLHAERDKRKDAKTAIVRLEQLYPFPEAELSAEVAKHAGAREFVWVQEEPGNMGALTWILPRLEPLLGGRPLRSVRRSESASPATGSAKAHALEQATLLSLAFAERP